MTEADRHYMERRSEPREPEEPQTRNYEKEFLSIASKVLLALSAALLVLAGIALL